MSLFIAALRNPLATLATIDIPFKLGTEKGAAYAGLAGIVGAATSKLLFNKATPLALTIGAVNLGITVINLVSNRRFADGKAAGAVAVYLAGVVGAITAEILFNAATPLIAGAICAYAAAINLMAVTRTGAYSGAPKFIAFTAMPITITLLLSLGASMAGCPVPLTLALLLSVETAVSTALGLYMSNKYL